MEPILLTTVAESCGGELRHHSPSLQVSRVCSDSRRVEPGDLFVALSGDRFDGHKFLAEAIRRGAAALLAERGRLEAESLAHPLVTVDNTRAALGRIAGAYRRLFSPAMVAVGGSNGKTTTKELLAAILRERFPTLWSPASFNNDIGVPHTLLELERRHEVAVLEVGANHPGELAPLLRLIQPRLGIVTSIGREHLEFFEDLAGVLREEGTLAEALPPEGLLAIHGDSPGWREIAARARCRVVAVGAGEHNEWRVAAARVDAEGTTFELASPRSEFSGEYRLRLLGRHQAANAALAIVVAAELGVQPDHARSGLAGCLPPKLRLQPCEAGGVLVLNDAYNANADSMLAALATLREFPCAGRRVAVLGDMQELGAQSEAAHLEVGRQAAQSGLSRLFAIGRWAGVLARAAEGAGLRQAEAFDSLEAGAAAVRAYVRPGDVVLVKASRVTGLDRLGEILRS